MSPCCSEGPSGKDAGPAGEALKEERAECQGRSSILSLAAAAALLGAVPSMAAEATSGGLRASG